jgi:hypothetical protein
VNQAILIDAWGTSRLLKGKFVLLTETAGKNPTLSVVECYENGMQTDGGGVICDTLTEALDVIEEQYEDKES